MPCSRMTGLKSAGKGLCLHNRVAATVTSTDGCRVGDVQCTSESHPTTSTKACCQRPERRVTRGRPEPPTFPGRFTRPSPHPRTTRLPPRPGLPLQQTTRSDRYRAPTQQPDLNAHQPHSTPLTVRPVGLGIRVREKPRTRQRERFGGKVRLSEYEVAPLSRARRLTAASAAMSQNDSRSPSQRHPPTTQHRSSLET
jgi:hypothetical protein